MQNNKFFSAIKKGFIYGILPHSFCIAFIIVSIIGATALISFLKPFMLNSYFFYLLILLTLVLATISAVIYLKRGQNLSIKGIKDNKKYLSILYSSVVGINLLLFLVIFPFVANYSFSTSGNYSGSNVTSKVISVDIPCSGHAPLIISELKKEDGITNVKYAPFNKFTVEFDLDKTSLERILSLQIFNSFRASEANED